jgi:thiol-disulfide isomerase/thioredoxin
MAKKRLYLNKKSKKETPMKKLLFLTVTCLIASSIGVSPVLHAKERANPVQEITSGEQFHTIINAPNARVVAQFYDPSCPICIRFEEKRIFQATAEKFPDITFVKVSVKKHRNLHKSYEITGYPSFVFFIEGEEVAREKGYKEKPQLAREIRAAFSR